MTDLCGYGVRAFSIDKAQYDNLLPVPGMRRRLVCRRGTDADEYAFIGREEDFNDAVRRCVYINENKTE